MSLQYRKEPDTSCPESAVGSGDRMQEILRFRLSAVEARHATSTATRKMLDRLSDDELVMAFLQHEHQGRDHVKQRAEKVGGIE